MTTAHKPTFHSAVGSAHQGGYHYPVRRLQFSALDLPAHKKLKFRQRGQNAPGEVAERDLKAELLLKEAAYEHTRLKQRLLDNAITGERSEPKKLPPPQSAPGLKITQTLALTDSTPSTTARAPPQEASTAALLKRLEEFDDADSSSEESSGGDGSADGEAEADSEEDEEAALVAELKRIKAERAAREAEAAAVAKRREKDKINEAVAENPLLFAGDYAVKERWDHDVVFRNQARGERKEKNRFVNDTIRNDFHRKFMRKYVK